jgi:hypothetical protein
MPHQIERENAHASAWAFFYANKSAGFVSESTFQ